jgi:hypothetical protein
MKRYEDGASAGPAYDEDEGRETLAGIETIHDEVFAEYCDDRDL